MKKHYLPLAGFLSGILMLSAACGTTHDSRAVEKSGPVTKQDSLSKMRKKNISGDELQKIGKACLLDMISALRKGDASLFNSFLVPESRVPERKFAEFTRVFNRQNGELVSVDYLGELDRGPMKVCIFKLKFLYSKTHASATRTAHGTEKAVQPDQMYRLYMGNVDGKWMVFNFITMD